MSRKQSSSAPAASYAMALSTGSPASRRPTKFTPLTTRPSFTSRQGMTRTLSIGRAPPRGKDQLERVLGVQPAVIEGPARDRALQHGAVRLQHAAHVVDGRQAA